MRAITRAGLLAVLYLLPVTLYVGMYRAAPSPADTATAGLENCGTVLRHERSPNADPLSVELCERPRRRAQREFLALATVNVGLLTVGPVVHAVRRRTTSRSRVRSALANCGVRMTYDVLPPRQARAKPTWIGRGDAGQFRPATPAAERDCQTVGFFQVRRQCRTP